MRWSTSLTLGSWAEFPHGAIYVMNIMRTSESINKAEDAGRMPKSV